MHVTQTHITTYNYRDGQLCLEWGIQESHRYFNGDLVT